MKEGREGKKKEEGKGKKWRETWREETNERNNSKHIRNNRADKMVLFLKIIFKI